MSRLARLKLEKPVVGAAVYRQEVFKLAASEQPRVIVEVGVFKGKLSRILARIPRLQRLVLVDPWEPDYRLCGEVDMEAIALEVAEWAATAPNVDVIRCKSIDAAALFPDASIDFWHTDGDHTLEGVMSDIATWLPKVRLGGILSGDNYEMKSVAEGVDKLCPNRKLAARGRLWWERKCV